MTTIKKYVLIILLAVSFSSCMITDQISSIQIEIMKPGIFVYAEDFNTVAVFDRNPIKYDTCAITYFPDFKVYVDTVNYHKLSNDCVDALSGFLKEQGYFEHTKNYRDSLNSLFADTLNPVTPAELFRKTKSDICIFLDYLNFKDFRYSYNQEFTTKAALNWTIAFRSDSVFYTYWQIDTLYYEISKQNLLDKSNVEMKSQLLDASNYLGQSFGGKLIPNWVQAERMYYQSNNRDMIKAENFALNQNWLKAAEIWNSETRNKNQRIVAKACFNLALACEMEGKYELAIDWITKSYSAPFNNNEEHKANCKRYINVLALRKKEIERLQKQVRNPENDSRANSL